jgi:hypothetical protein
MKSKVIRLTNKAFKENQNEIINWLTENVGNFKEKKLLSERWSGGYWFETTLYDGIGWHILHDWDEECADYFAKVNIQNSKHLPIFALRFS